MEILFEFEKEENLPIGDFPQEDLDLLIKVAKTKIKPEELDIELLTKGFWFCYDSHKNVKRKSGKLYYSHPVKVALILLNNFPYVDTETLVAALLHDTIEDVDDVNYELVAREFTPDIAMLVDGVTKINLVSEEKNKNKAYTYKKIFSALVKDIRIILIKLADRLHNIRTIHYLKEAKQKDIALETINFYTPIAHKLGLSKIKAELENLSFFVLDKDTYTSIREALNSKRKEFINYIKIFTSHIQKTLNDQNIKHTLTIIHKHEYEIYKIIQEGKLLSDIDNFYSIVIILESDDITQCYTAHGLLANSFTTIHFIDFISNPKVDWYRSLNSEIYGPDGKKVEVIIRTNSMEKIAEEGFFSAYNFDFHKNRGIGLNKSEIESWEEWVEEIIQNRGEDAIQMIWNSVKINLFDNAITIFDRDGGSHIIPEGSTILDYAFLREEKRGLQLVAGKINGVTQDIGFKLNDGDQIELITSENTIPKPEWNRFVVTNKATIALYKYFKKNGEHEHHSSSDKNKKEYKLKIIGEDKEKMLQQITEAIGQNNMVSIQVNTTGALFTGIMILKLDSRGEINILFNQLFRIKGIRLVEYVD